MNLVRRLATPPVFSDDEQTDTAYLLHIITLAIAGLAVTYGLIAGVMAANVIATAYGVALLAIASGIYLANAHSHTRPASWVLVAVLWLVFTMPALTAGERGVQHVSFTGYVVPVLVAGLLIGGPAGLIVAGLSVLAGLLRLYTEDKIQDRGDPNHTLLLTWLGHTIIFSMTAVLVALDNHHRRRALARARHSEHTLATQNQKLRQQITERERIQEALLEREEAARRLQDTLRVLHTVTIELSKASTLDELCHQAVELGRSRLGFDRLALFLFDENSQTILGTFGTDPAGNLRDERSWRRRLVDDRRVQEVLRARTMMNYWEEVELYDEYHIVGRGWNAMAVLWNGDKSIGWLVADNLIQRQPLAPYQLEILTLYGTALGHLATQRRTEETLRSSEERFSKAFHANTAGISIATLDEGRYLDVNRRWLEMFGFEREEVIGHTVADLNLLVDPEQRKGIIDTLRREGRMEPLEFEWRTKSGTPIVGMISAVLIELRGTTYVMSMTQDITQRKRAEAALRESEARYRSIFENSPEGIYRTTPTGRFLEANLALARMLGYDTVDEVMALHLPDDLYLNPEDRRNLSVAMEAVGVLRDVELVWKKKDGNPITVSVHGQAIRGSDGQVVYYEGVVIDVTGRKLAEQRQRELDLAQERLSLLTEFFDKISHDLKTPLSIINTCLYMIENVTDPASQQVNLLQIKDQTQHLERYIQDVLTISRLNSMPVIELKPVDLNRLLRHILERLRPSADKKHLQTTLELANEVLTVLGDEQELDRLMVNLIENAFTYTPERGAVAVRTYSLDNRCVLEVTDTGIGIHEDELPYIFERFYRTPGARSTERRGTGLGLTIVKKIVDMHQGTIEVRSTVGAGSTFAVALPSVQ